MNDFENYLSEVLSHSEGELSTALTYAVMPGGKRIRSTFLLNSFLCFTDDEVRGRGVEFSFPFASAIEFIHTYSLVHDDLPSMDNDDIRRGKPSVHKAFGEGMAVLTGDALLNLAYEIMSSAILNEKNFVLLERKVKAMNAIAEYSGIKGMVGGQAIDITKKISDYENEEEILEMTALKTACLLTASIVAGAYLGAPDFEEIKALKEFGYAYGMAFQISDDISDYEEDLRIEKPTYVTLYGIDRANEKLYLFMQLADEALRKINRDTEYFSAQLSNVKNIFT